MKPLKLIVLSALVLTLASCVNLSFDHGPSSSIKLADLQSPENKANKIGLVYFSSKIKMKEDSTLATMYYSIEKKSDKKISRPDDDNNKQEQRIRSFTEHLESPGFAEPDQYKGHQIMALLLPEGDYILKKFSRDYIGLVNERSYRHTTNADIGIPFKVRKGKVTYAGSVYFIFKRVSLKVYFKNSFDKAYKKLEAGFPTLYNDLKGKKQIWYKLPKEKVLVQDVKLEGKY